MADGWAGVAAVEVDDVPILSLEQLVADGSPKSVRDEPSLEVVFASCQASAEECEGCLSRVRRCLLCPMLTETPTHAARAVLFDAIARELSLPDAEPFDAPLSEVNALRHALADAEVQLASCQLLTQGELAGAGAAQLFTHGELARLHRREEELGSHAARLRREIALEEARLSRADEEANQPLPQPKKGLVRRALSFEKRQPKAKTAGDGRCGGGGGGGGGCRCGSGVGGDAHGNGGSGGGTGCPAVPAATASDSAAAADGGETKGMKRSTSFGKMKRALAGGAKGLRRSTSFGKSAAGTATAVPAEPAHGKRSTRVLKVGGASSAVAGGPRAVVPPDTAATAAPPELAALAEPLVLESGAAGRSYHLLLCALISVSQRRLAEIASVSGEVWPADAEGVGDGQGDGQPAPLPLTPSGALRLMDPPGAGTPGARGSCAWLLDAFALHFGVREACRSISLLGAVLGDRCALLGDGGSMPNPQLLLARDSLRAAIRSVKLEVGSREEGSNLRAETSLPAQRMARALPELAGQCDSVYEVRVYSACTLALRAYAKSAIPLLIADADTDQHAADPAGGATEDVASTGPLLYHLQLLQLACQLTLGGAHRRAPRDGAEGTPFPPGAVESSCAADEDELAFWDPLEFGERTAAVGASSSGEAVSWEAFEWDEARAAELAQRAMRRVLRDAVVLQCGQEMRAAEQTARAGRQPGGKGGKANPALFRQPVLGGLLQFAATSVERSYDDALRLELMRLRRLRERLARSFGCVLPLIGPATGGGAIAVAVWSSTLHEEVFAPLQQLAAELPLSVPAELVLGVGLEHRRLAAVIADAQEGERARERAREKARRGGAAGGAAERLGAAAAQLLERGFYSPFVFHWLDDVFGQLGRWLRDAMRGERWQRRRSRPLLGLFRVSHAVLHSLAALDILLQGEAVTAAQLVADAVTVFAASAHPDKDEEAPSRGGDAPEADDALAVRLRALLSLAMIEAQAKRKPHNSPEDGMDAVSDPPQALPWEETSDEDSEAAPAHGEAPRLRSRDAISGVISGAVAGVASAAQEGREEESTDGAVVRACSKASDASSARLWLETLVEELERSLAAQPEQQAIATQSFGAAFSSLKVAFEAHLAQFSSELLAPIHNRVRALSAQPVSRHHPANPHRSKPRAVSWDLDGGNAVAGRVPAWREDAEAAADVAALEDLLQRLRGWLVGEVMVRLLQRVWTQTVAAVGGSLRQNMYVPQALGFGFSVCALQLLDGLLDVLSEGGQPSREWLRRRAAPLRSVLQLTALPTAALLTQHAVQSAGSAARAATLTALSLRMDDPLAAAVVAEEVAQTDPGSPDSGAAGAAAQLRVDGTGPLAAALDSEPSLRGLIDSQLGTHSAERVGGEVAPLRASAAPVHATAAADTLDASRRICDSAERRLRGLKLVRR